MELIDKSALVAEIERRIKEYNTPVDRLGSNNIRLHECKDILSFLNTLEVKDVDLDKEARHYLLHDHESPLSRVLHEIDLLIEMQYHRDIENAFKAGVELGIRSKATKASEFLKKHFKETPQEELDKEWKEIEPLNDIGTDVLEYANKREQ